MATPVRQADESAEEFEARKREHDAKLVGAYRALFSAGDSAQLVLEDLDEFCRMDRTSLTWGQSGLDMGLTMAMEGRREVRLRIESALRAPKH